MNDFERNLTGFPELDVRLPDPRVADYTSDGFATSPCSLPWANYRKVKSLLLMVLGNRVFEALFRLPDPKRRQLNGETLKTAANILGEYVAKPSPDNDLQSTLIVNVIAKRATIASNGVRASEFEAAQTAEIDRVFAACELDADYVTHLKSKLHGDDGVLSTPWWTPIYYG